MIKLNERWITEIKKITNTFEGIDRDDLYQDLLTYFHCDLPANLLNKEINNLDGYVKRSLWNYAKSNVRKIQTTRKQYFNDENGIYINTKIEELDYELPIDEESLNLAIQSVLSEIEKTVIKMYFYNELNHREISEILNTSEQYISKVRRGAIKKLQLYFKNIIL